MTQLKYFLINHIIAKEKNHFLFFLIIGILGLLILITKIYYTKSAVGGDSIYYFINIKTILFDNDVDYENDYKFFYNKVSPFTGNRKLPSIPPLNPKTNKRQNHFPIGNTILLAPFFYLGNLTTHTIKILGFPVLLNGYGLTNQTMVAIGSYFYGWIGLLLLYKFGKSIFSVKASFLGCIFIWLASPLLYYMTLEPIMSHTLSMFGTTIFIIYFFENFKKLGLKQWGILGFLSGLIGLVRLQDLLTILILIIFYLLNKFFNEVPCNPDNRYKYWKIILYLLVLGSLLSLQGSINITIYGSFFNLGYLEEGFSFPYLLRPKIFFTLFSPDCGLILWSPIIIFSLIGLYFIVKKELKFGTVLLVIFFCHLYLASSYSHYDQGDSFGNRMLINLTPIFGFGLMAFYDKFIKKNMNKILLASICLVVININAIFLYCFRIIGNSY